MIISTGGIDLNWKRLIGIIVLVTLIAFSLIYFDFDIENTDVEITFFKNRTLFNAYEGEEYTLDLVYFIDKKAEDYLENNLMILSIG